MKFTALLGLLLALLLDFASASSISNEEKLISFSSAQTCVNYCKKNIKSTTVAIGCYNFCNMLITKGMNYEAENVKRVYQ